MIGVLILLALSSSFGWLAERRRTIQLNRSRRALLLSRQEATAIETKLRDELRDLKARYLVERQVGHQ
jgi:hypothetical protein